MASFLVFQPNGISSLMECDFLARPTDVSLQIEHQFVLPRTADEAVKILALEGDCLQGIILDWQSDADSEEIAVVYDHGLRRLPSVPLAFRSGYEGQNISPALLAHGIRVDWFYPHNVLLAQITTDLILRCRAAPHTPGGAKYIGAECAQRTFG